MEVLSRVRHFILTGLLLHLDFHEINVIDQGFIFIVKDNGVRFDLDKARERENFEKGFGLMYLFPEKILLIADNSSS